MIDGVMDNRSFFAPHSRDLMSVQDTVYTPIILSEDTNDSEGPQLIDPTYFSGVESGDDTFPTPRRVTLSNSHTIANNVHTSSISNFIDFFTTSRPLYEKHRIEAQIFSSED